MFSISFETIDSMSSIFVDGKKLVLPILVKISSANSVVVSVGRDKNLFMTSENTNLASSADGLWPDG
jgi:hypothetical protein